LSLGHHYCSLPNDCLASCPLSPPLGQDPAAQNQEERWDISSWKTSHIITVRAETGVQSQSVCTVPKTWSKKGSTVCCRSDHTDFTLLLPLVLCGLRSCLLKLSIWSFERRHINFYSELDFQSMCSAQGNSWIIRKERVSFRCLNPVKQECVTAWGSGRFQQLALNGI